MGSRNVEKNNKNRPLSLLVVNERVYPVHTGGMELATYHFVNELLRQGHNIRILSAKEHRVDESGFPKFLELIYTSHIRIVNFFMFLIFGFFRILHKHKNVDFLHGQPVFPSGLLAMIAGKVLGKPVILWARGADIYEYLDNPITRPIVKWIITQSALMIALTEDLKNKIHKYCPKKPISVIPNGVSFPKRIKLNKTEFLQKYGFSDDYNQKRFLLFVGRLVSFKGLEYLLDAVPEIVNKDPNVVLLIVGGGKDKIKLIKLSYKLGINNHVVFLGQLPWIEVLKWFKISDLFVYPTLRGQGMNNAVLEAMQSGLPVIATKVGGLPSIITNGESGILVCSKNSKLLAKTIIRVLSNLQDYKIMGKNAKRYVEMHHSWEKVVNAYSKNIFQIYRNFYS